MKCKICDTDDELRCGVCFDCATVGERRAAKRSVLQHIRHGLRHIALGYWTEARIDFSWAWERLTKTGDYKPGGYFEEELERAAVSSPPENPRT